LAALPGKTLLPTTAHGGSTFLFTMDTENEITERGRENADRVGQILEALNRRPSSREGPDPHVGPGPDEEED